MVEHVVVDSGGFIRNAPLKDIGKEIYTIREVVTEIRDKPTRQRLQVLPYELRFKEPSSDAIKYVTDFAKKTGDYKSLSAIDIRVLALTYQLEKENCGTDHLRNEPNRNITWQATQKSLQNPTKIAGFYVGKKESKPESTVELEKNTDNLENSHEKTEQISTSTEIDSEHNLSVNNIDTKAVLNDSESETSNKTDKVQFEAVDGEVLEGCLEEDSDDAESDIADGDDDDDDGGWITPSNIKQIKQKMGDRNNEKADVKVGCLTTDFSMQNVLLQMHLNVISVDGMLIKRAKNYVNRCYGCFKISTDMSRDFCHHCGNATLQRVSMTVDEDGSIRYFLSSRRAISTRGTKYSLPMPKGGKHATNPVLCEDQREAQQRTAKASKVKYDVFDPDYASHSSPFAPIDTHSRSAQLGIRGIKQSHRGRRNPNESKKVYGRRK